MLHLIFFLLFHLFQLIHHLYEGHSVDFQYLSNIMGVTLKIMEHLKNDELMNNDMDAYARVSDFNFIQFI